MTAAGIITLLSDCAVDDPFLGQVRGRLCVLSAQLRVWDLAHQVPGDDTYRLGFRWRRAWPYFPEGSVHVCLHDDGSSSHPWLVQAAGHWLVAFSWATLSAALPPATAFTRWPLPSPMRDDAISPTFRARDWLLPVAAALAAGDSAVVLGGSVGWKHISACPEKRRNHAQRGRVVDIDAYGNLITDIALTDDERRGIEALEIAGQRIPWVAGGYADGQRLGALSGCDGYVEVSLSGGHAARHLGIEIGCGLCLRWSA